MSAAAAAAGYLFASGRLNRRREDRRAQRTAEAAAEQLKRQREEKQANPISTAPAGARR